ncbi:hypothetical protein LXL04_002112 [Taraxacum kok-saghyz]
MSEPFMVRFQNSCSSFCTSLRGQYSLRSISFSTSHVRALAASSPIVWTCPFHHVRAPSSKVHAAYLTLKSSGQELMAKTASVFSNQRVSSITPPVPEKDFGSRVISTSTTTSAATTAFTTSTLTLVSSSGGIVVC